MTGLSRATYPFEVKEAPGETGVFEGYASVFGVQDLGRDTVMPGAFAKSLASGRKVKMLWQHDQGQPIGVFDHLAEDSKGLFVRGQLAMGVQRAREAKELIGMGAMGGLSIGYRTVKAVAGADRSRKLVELDLHEISVVTMPMLPEAQITGIKSADQITTEREFEAFLRDAGWSRKEATALALHGFKAIAGQRDAGPDGAQSDAVKGIMEQIRQLKEKTNVW
jgi:HK97 family phage prohead protease